MTAFTRTTVGAKLHDDFADGDFTANPAWTSETGTQSIVSGAIQAAASAAQGWARSAVSIANSDYISWRASVATSDFTLSQHRIEWGANANRTGGLYGIFFRSGAGGCQMYNDIGNIGSAFTASLSDSNFHTFAIKWNGSSFGIYRDDTLLTTITDSTYSSAAAIRVMAATTTASQVIKFDDVCVMDSWNVTCSGLPTGWKLRVISDVGGTAVATATESSGTATVDLTGKCAFPYYGVQVLDGSSVVQQTLAPSATVSGHTISGTFGGDAYTYTVGDAVSGSLTLSGTGTESKAVSDSPVSPHPSSDSYGSDTSANYSVDAGTAPIVSAGTLVATSFSESLWVWASSTPAVNRTVTAKTHLSTAASGAIKGITARRIDASNFLLCQLAAASLSILKKDGGSYTVLANNSSISLADGANTWIKAVFADNVITAYAYSDSALTTLLGSVTYTLAGADATKYGSVTSKMGLRWSTGTSADYFDDLSDTPTELGLLLSGSVSESLTHGGNTYNDAASGSVTLSGTKTGSNSGNETPAGTLTLLPTAKAQTTGWLSRFDGPIDSFTGPGNNHPTGTLTLSGTAADAYVFGGPSVRLTVAVSDSPVTNLSVSDAGVTSLVLSDAAV